MSFGWSSKCAKYHSIMERKLRSRVWGEIIDSLSADDVGLESGVKAVRLTSGWKYSGVV